MGYDVSFHPVDVKFVRDRVVPYVLGKGNFDDVLPDMIQIERNRQRAAAWAYKLIDLSTREWGKQREAKESRKKPPKTLLPDWFDSDLHVWGRPFFITAQSPEEVSQIIDRYCAAQTDEAVDALVREEMIRLNPVLPNRIKLGRQKSYSDEQIARGLIANLDQARAWLELANRGEPFVDDEGREHDARNVFAHNFPLAAVAFAALRRPGWMSRGLVWPTLMLNKAGFSERDFETPAPLFTRLFRKVPELESVLEPTIVCNDVLGGYLRPGRVRAMRGFFQEAGDYIVEILEYGKEDLRKIDEALYDASRLKFAFVEAAEIYSGIMGIVN